MTGLNGRFDIRLPSHVNTRCYCKNLIFLKAYKYYHVTVYKLGKRMTEILSIVDGKLSPSGNL